MQSSSSLLTHIITIMHSPRASSSHRHRCQYRRRHCDHRCRVCKNVKHIRFLFARNTLRRIAGSFRRVLLRPKGRWQLYAGMRPAALWQVTKERQESLRIRLRIFISTLKHKSAIVFASHLVFRGQRGLFLNTDRSVHAAAVALSAFCHQMQLSIDANMFCYSFVWLVVCLFVCLFACLLVRLFACAFVFVFVVCVCVFVCAFVCFFSYSLTCSLACSAVCFYSFD